MARYADVIVNISRDELDRSFQYRIPDELQEAVTLGTKVEFPFSTRPKATGYVVGLSDEPKIEESRIRDISGLAKRSVTVDDRMMTLASWMKEAYGCTYSQALKTVLPAKAAVRKGRTRVESVPLPTEAERAAYVPAKKQRTGTGPAFCTA